MMNTNKRNKFTVQGHGTPVPVGCNGAKTGHLRSSSVDCIEYPMQSQGGKILKDTDNLNSKIEQMITDFEIKMQKLYKNKSSKNTSSEVKNSINNFCNELKEEIKSKTDIQNKERVNETILHSTVENKQEHLHLENLSEKILNLKLALEENKLENEKFKNLVIKEIKELKGNKTTQKKINLVDVNKMLDNLKHITIPNNMEKSPKNNKENNYLTNNNKDKEVEKYFLDLIKRGKKISEPEANDTTEEAFQLQPHQKRTAKEKAKTQKKTEIKLKTPDRTHINQKRNQLDPAIVIELNEPGNQNEYASMISQLKANLTIESAGMIKMAKITKNGNALLTFEKNTAAQTRLLEEIQATVKKKR